MIKTEVKSEKGETKKRIPKAKGHLTKTNSPNPQFNLWRPRVAFACGTDFVIAETETFEKLLDETLKDGGEFSFIAAGQSMAPLILPGSRLFIKFCSRNKIKIGDIVFFKQGDDFLTHRLIYKSKRLWLTKAETAPLPDKSIKPSQVLGKVTKIERNGKVSPPKALIKIQNLFYLKEFLRLNRLFWENSLKVINLKGISLSQILGEKLPNRFLSDLDFLVQRKDFPKVARILRSLGFRMKKQKGVPDFHYREPYPIHQEITFKKGGAFTLTVDIHQEPVGSTQGKLNPLPLDKNQKIAQDLIKRARLAKKKGGGFWALEENDLLFYLCLHHFFHHNCRGIEQLANIARVIEKLPIDWEIFSRKVKGYSLENYLYYPLLLAKNLLKAKVPKKILDEFKPKSIFSNLVPLFINQKNIFRPRSNITQLEETNKENIVLRFLIIDKPFLWKIWYLTRPRVLFGFRPYLSVMPLTEGSSSEAS